MKEKNHDLEVKATETPTANGPLSRRGALRWGGLLAGGGLLALLGINPPSVHAACDDSCSPGCGVVCHRRTHSSYRLSLRVTGSWPGRYNNECIRYISAGYCSHTQLRDCDGYYVPLNCTYRIGDRFGPISGRGRAGGDGWVKISDFTTHYIWDIACS